MQRTEAQDAEKGILCLFKTRTYMHNIEILINVQQAHLSLPACLRASPVSSTHPSCPALLYFHVCT